MSKYLTEKEAAEMLSMTTGALRTQRHRKKNMIPYYKIGRIVRYKASDIERFMDSRAINMDA